MRIKTYGGANETLVEMDGEHVDEGLFSYSTPVAAFVPGIGYVRTTEHYSSTTTRHINKYLDGREAVKVGPSDLAFLATSRLSNKRTPPMYDKEAVAKAIESDPSINSKEAKLIHRLLQGRATEGVTQ